MIVDLQHLARAGSSRTSASRMTDGGRRGRNIWLRTNGVNTNGAAAKVRLFDILGKKVRPGTLGKIKVG